MNFENKVRLRSQYNEIIYNCKLLNINSFYYEKLKNSDNMLHSIIKNNVRLHNLYYMIMLSRLHGFGTVFINKLKKIRLSKFRLTDKYIKNHYKLTNSQKISLKYKPNIYINRSIIDEYISSLKLTSDFEVVGSYRRKKEFVNDVDIITTDSELYKQFHPIEIYASGPKKIMMLCKYKPKSIKHYNKMYEHISDIPLITEVIYIQVDIRITDKKSYPFARLYFTGSKEFNIKLRKKAKELNLKLNEYNEWGNDIKTEADIFKKLKVPYAKPEDR